AEDGIRDLYVTGVQTCALPISRLPGHAGCPLFWTGCAGKQTVPPLSWPPKAGYAAGMYEHFEHTADLGLRVRAPDLGMLFAEARSEERRVGKEGRPRWVGERRR